MENVSEFNTFLKDHVNVNPTRLERLNRGVRGVTEHIAQNLAGYEKHDRQGSYALNTIIRPVNDAGYDVDVLIYMSADRNERAAYYINEVYHCLRENHNYADKVSKKSRSVFVDFSGDFSLDVVPCIMRKGALSVCNRTDSKFEPTDGTGYHDWFNSKANITNGNLKAVVKLLKYLRDHKDNFEVSSVILTTLIGHSVHANELSTKFRSVPLTLKLVSNRINAFLHATPNRPRFRNPALRSERFSRHWDQNDYRNFKEKFRIYNDKINSAYAESDPSRSIQKWRALFGDNFGR